MLPSDLKTEKDILTSLQSLAKDEKPSLTIYTDGACSGNPGPGGWGVVLCYQGIQQDLSGGEPHTTNNRMEMTAALKALEVLPLSCRVDLYTDSQYLKDGMTQWLANWKRNGWKTVQKKPVKNQDLWEALDRLVSLHEIQWHWIKGHSNHEENDHADALARNAIIAQAMLMDYSGST